LYESGEGERGGIVEEEVVDVIEQESEPQGCRVAAAPSLFRRPVLTAPAAVPHYQVYHDSQATGALRFIPQTCCGVGQEITSESAISYRS